MKSVGLELNLLLFWLLSTVVFASPFPQDAPTQLQFLANDDPFDIEFDEGTGHFSQWAKQSKFEFLRDLTLNRAQDWTLVFGNEGGDLDSMASALAFAYHLAHLPEPTKAVALLQTAEDALDLRPENKLALERARMASGHRDLLTIDELPIKPFDMWHRIEGVVLVDHNVPRGEWGNVTVLSIVDHHADRGFYLDASPRIIEKSASCSSLVAKIILDDLEKHGLATSPGPLPVELAELLLRAIAIDSDGLKKGDSDKVDRETAKRLFGLSGWREGEESFKKIMKNLDQELTGSRKSLDTLSLRDLLRRDWKGDAVPTLSKRYPYISLGLASIPVSMEEQILRLPEQTAPEWFATERAWTAEAGCDVSVVLTSFRDEVTDIKYHDIALVVAHGWAKRLTLEAADSLFEQIKASIVSAPELEDLEEWIRPDGKPLLPRRAVWRHRNEEAGRKLVRPVVERAVKLWAG